MMTTLKPRTLPTLAMLKANFDSGHDHIGMFLPFVRDAIQASPRNDFKLEEIQTLLEERHALNMPMDVIRTLVSRAKRKKEVRFEGGSYFKTNKLARHDLTTERGQVEQEQREVAKAFQQFASQIGADLGSEDEALEAILEFLDKNQIGLLLDREAAEANRESSKVERLTAQFITWAAANDSITTNRLRGMVEGLVLQNTMFLGDLNRLRKKFNRLRLFFDTGFLFKALGYEGPASEKAANEALRLLSDAGATCGVFRRTLDEILRVLAVYRDNLGTAAGRSWLRPTPITRHFMTSKYTPSDIAQEMAFLDKRIADIGLRISVAPQRHRDYTLDERDLSVRIQRPTDSLDDPRIVHDVDCIAAILTLRAGRTSNDLAEAQAAFVTTTGKLVHNADAWYRDNDGVGLPPVISVQAVSNIAWLKQPAFAGDLKLDELIALCRAALQPSMRIWTLFSKHLEKLLESGEITSDEVAAILASELTDEMLLRIDNDEDVEAVDLNEVVQRVKDSYASLTAAEFQRVEEAAAGRLRQAENARSAAESRIKELERESVKLRSSLEGMAGAISELITKTVAYGFVFVLALGAVAGIPVVSELLPGSITMFAYVALGVVLVVSWLSLWRGWYLEKARESIAARLKQWLLRTALGKQQQRSEN